MFSTIWIQWIPLRLKMASSRIESILESSTNPGRCTWSQNRRWTMTWPMMEPLYQYAFSDDRISRYASSILQERCRRPHQSLWWFLARHETFLFPGVGEEEKKSKGPQLCWTGGGKKGQPPCPTKKNADYPNACPAIVRSSSPFLGEVSLEFFS